MLDLRYRATSCVLAYVILVGCQQVGPPSDGPSSAFTQLDSSGVTVSVTPGDAALAPLPWTVSPLPDLVIGSNSTHPELFFSIEGLAARPDGGVVVVDRGDREIRVFDAAGLLQRRMGRSGQGPGEFEAMSLSPRIVNDSLLVYDGALRRFHHVSAADLGYRMRTIRTVRTGRPPLGIVGDHVLFGWARLPTRPKPGVNPYTVTFRWVNLVTDELTEIASVVMQPLYSEVVPGRTVTSAWPIPFTRHYPPAVTTSRGALIYDDGPAELREYGLDGRLLQILRVEQPSRPVTEELIDAWVEELVLANPLADAPLKRVLPDIPLPTHLPWFVSLLRDAEGWTWAGIYEPGLEERPATRWMIFGDDGRAYGTVETPEGLAVNAITATGLFGVWTDPLGVQEVRRHSLQR